MKVQVKCFSALADSDNCRYDQSRVVSLPQDAATVKNLAQQVPVAEQDVSVIFVNGERATMGTILSDGDRVAFVPPTGGM